MRLDPHLLGLLQATPATFETPIDWVAVRQSHAVMAATVAAAGASVPVESVESCHVDGPAGALELRVYRPQEEAAMTLIHFHGGGWALGDLDMIDQTVRRICQRLRAVVVSCTYRKAPEHPFPAAYDDALAATRWVLAEAGRLGGSALPVVIAGDSAGGNLASAVTLALREQARRDGPGAALPALDAQLLLYPGVDIRDSAFDTDSYRADRDPSTRTAMLRECIMAYARDQDRGDWRMSPLAAADLSDLPPAMVVVLSVDPLRDQAVDYAARLVDAGVRCELVEFPHLTHGFCHIANLVPAADTAFDEVLARFGRFVEAGREDR